MPPPPPDFGRAPDQDAKPDPQPKKKTKDKDKDKDDDEKKKRLGRIYVTYQKYNHDTHLYYSGRTSMVVDLNKPLRPQALLAVELRDKEHHVDERPEATAKGFERAELDKFDVGNAVDYKDRYDDLAYQAIRGREQQLIDYRGGAWSDTGEPHKTENKWRGVDKAHAWSRRFYDVATARFGEALAPYDMRY